MTPHETQVSTQHIMFLLFLLNIRTTMFKYHVFNQLRVLASGYVRQATYGHLYEVLLEVISFFPIT